MAATDTALIERFRAARRDPGLVVLEGLHALKHALRFGALVVEAAAPDPVALAALADELAPDVSETVRERVGAVAPGTFDALAPSGPAEVIALARRPFVDGPGLLARGPGYVVLLDGPRHLGNVGAAVRVAAAAGAAGLLVTGDSDPWHPVAVRGGAGLQFALPVARVSSLAAATRPLVALDPSGEPLAGAGVPEGALLAFGSERHGLSADVLARAVMRLALPMRAGVSSLNLATAVAAALYSLDARA